MAITALQHIERAKGAAQERKEIAREIRMYIRMYKGDLILKNVLRSILARGEQDA